MPHGQKWAPGLGIAAAVAGALRLAVAWRLPSDEDLAARLTAEAEARLGVKVTIGAAHWALLPTPVIVINGLHTQQTPPVVIGQLSAYPKLRELLQRKLVFARIDLDNAVFPPNAMHGFINLPDRGRHRHAHHRQRADRQTESLDAAGNLRRRGHRHGGVARHRRRARPAVQKRYASAGCVCAKTSKMKRRPQPTRKRKTA